MEEKEVVQYLKDNMKKGISLHFMPSKVQDWIRKNYRDCLYLNSDGVHQIYRKYCVTHM